MNEPITITLYWINAGDASNLLNIAIGITVVLLGLVFMLTAAKFIVKALNLFN